jgi:hypothetical protein
MTAYLTESNRVCSCRRFRHRPVDIRLADPHLPAWRQVQRVRVLLHHLDLVALFGERMSAERVRSYEITPEHNGGWPPTAPFTWVAIVVRRVTLSLHTFGHLYLVLRSDGDCVE